MINSKVFRLESSDGTNMQLGIIEQFKNEHSLLFTWESSLMMTAYIMSKRSLFSNTSILEIGAGVGLPSLACGHPTIGAKKVAITDRSEELHTLMNLRHVVSLNDLNGVCTVEPLSWDQPHTWLQIHVDYILGSDVLYSTEDFFPLMSFLSHMFAINPSAVFFTTYKNRSARRTLVPHLQLHGMKAEVIPARSFLHQCHFTSGVCLFETTPCVESNADGGRTLHDCSTSIASKNDLVKAVDCNGSEKRRRLNTQQELFCPLKQDELSVEDKTDDFSPSTEYSLERVNVFDETYLLRIQLI